MGEQERIDRKWKKEKKEMRKDQGMFYSGI